MKKYAKSNYISYGICPSCKNFWEDPSVNDAECRQADNLTEEQYEKYFIDEQPGCPFYEEAEYPDDYEYYESLMSVECAEDIDNTITIHYKRSYPGFSLNPFTIDFGEFVKQFGTVKGDPAKNDYGLFVRWANISGVNYKLAYFSDDLDKCISEAKKWLNINNWDSEWLEAKHFFINIINTYSGEELYYADVWEDGTKSWANTIP